MNFKRWEKWKRLRDFCNKRMKRAWMAGGNCDSCCPRCKQWESLGNDISTAQKDDDSCLRRCTNCGYKWVAIFTPTGFVPIPPDENTEEVSK